MIDRAINLLVICVLLIAMISLAVGLHRAWEETDAWNKEWTSTTDGELRYSPEEVLTAMRKADSVGARNDVEKLREYLNENFRPTGRISVRFTIREIWESFLFLVIPAFLLVVPVSLNYVRHGKFRVWNGNT